MYWPLAIIAVATGGTIAALHWFPWNRWIGHELKPPWSYVVGTSVLLAAFVAWILWDGSILAHQPWMAAVALGTISAAGGITDIIAYRIDRKTGDRLYSRVFGGLDEDGQSNGP